ncbi:MAG: DUF2497 domain-containing protein [Sphingorhabdus sp.]
MAEDRGEPSMEEILSSIKRIIADDEAIKAPPTKKAAEKKPADADTAEGEEILELTESAEIPDEGEKLLDEKKAKSLAHSFSTLQTLSEPGATPQIVRSGETSLEGLTRELMRPMLKEWLDANLPDIVEAMVAREISRITKKD